MFNLQKFISVIFSALMSRFSIFGYQPVFCDHLWTDRQNILQAALSYDTCGCET